MTFRFPDRFLSYARSTCSFNCAKQPSHSVMQVCPQDSCPARIVRKISVPDPFRSVFPHEEQQRNLVSRLISIMRVPPASCADSRGAPGIHRSDSVRRCNPSCLLLSGIRYRLRRSRCSLPAVHNAGCYTKHELPHPCIVDIHRMFPSVWIWYLYHAWRQLFRLRMKSSA